MDGGNLPGHQEARRPGGAGMVVGARGCLICEVNLVALLVGAPLDGREGFLHPYPPFFRVAFQCPPDWPLRGESEHLQDLADVLQRVVYAEFPPDQIPDYFPGPQAEIELNLARITTEPFVQLEELLVS